MPDIPAGHEGHETSTEQVHTGTCFCRSVEVEVRGEPAAMGFCHCRSCRAYAGAPVSAFTLWPAAEVVVTKGQKHLASYNQRGFSNRRYCSNCGGHVLVEHPTLGLTDVHASMLPELKFSPALHVNYAEAVLPLHDGLPKLKDFPAEFGGSGEVLPE